MTRGKTSIRAKADLVTMSVHIFVTIASSKIGRFIMSILICTDCGVSADEDDWKETLDEGGVVCPTCSALKHKSELSIVATMHAPKQSSIGTLRKILDQCIDSCPKCGQKICICSLKEGLGL